MVTAVDIRARIEQDVFDYQQLTGLLGEYAKARDRIGELLRQGHVIRIKKGLYTFGESLRRRPLLLPVLANLIYGPSYVSGVYALSYHGLIPEGVAVVTSQTTGRSCEFETPFGRFSYRRSMGGRYPVGVARVEIENSAYLIATPEKALFDAVYDDSRFDGGSEDEILVYLTEDLRIERADLQRLDRARLEALEKVARGRMLALTGCLKRLTGGGA